MAASLGNVKVLLDIDQADTSEDDLLNLYISRATNFILNYCNLTEVPTNLNDTVEDIAVIRYRLKGVEGVTSESKGSLSESYIEALPSDIINQLNKFRRLEVV